MAMRLVLIFAIVLSLSTTSAQAALTYDPGLSAIASGISGVMVPVNVDTDPASWASESAAIGGSDMTLGYSTPMGTNEVFVGPTVASGIATIHGGQVSTLDLYNAAVAVMSLIHESYHIKLQSLDEGRVNACALQAFPQVIQTYFDVEPTTSKMVVVASSRNYRVRIYGRWVIRHKIIRRQSIQTVTNHTYNGLVSDAHAFYAGQPAPYSTGSCS